MEHIKCELYNTSFEAIHASLVYEQHTSIET